MKKVIYLAVLAMVAVACGVTKNAANLSEQPAKKEMTSLDGKKMVQESIKMSGVDMEKVLSDDGTKMIDRPVKWFAGIGKANDKAVAISLAEAEARASISRTLNNMVLDNSKRGNVANNGKVQQALTSYWEQVSTSIQNGCEPYGDAVVSYYPETEMFEAVAKVGIRGDRYTEMLNPAKVEAPAGLSPEEQKQFIEVNKSIMDAARGL